MTEDNPAGLQSAGGSLGLSSPLSRRRPWSPPAAATTARGPAAHPAVFEHAEEKQLELGAALLGPKNDKSINQAGYMGIQAADEELDNLTVTAVLDNQATLRSRRTRSRRSPRTTTSSTC